MDCPYCNQLAIKYGTERLKDGSQLQTYYCRGCKKRFNERTATPMARLRTSKNMVVYALKMRTEGREIGATGRILEKSHSTVIRWEKRVANQVSAWSPPAPPGINVTVESPERNHIQSLDSRSSPPSKFL